MFTDEDVEIIARAQALTDDKSALLSTLYRTSIGVLPLEEYLLDLYLWDIYTIKDLIEKYPNGLNKKVDRIKHAILKYIQRLWEGNRDENCIS